MVDRFMVFVGLGCGREGGVTGGESDRLRATRQKEMMATAKRA